MQDHTPAPARLTPPTVTPPEQALPLPKLALGFLKNPIGTLAKPIYEERMTVLRMRGARTAWITDPELLEQLLVTDAHRFGKSVVEQRVFRRTTRDSVITADGDAWRWQRRVLAPMFRPAEISRFSGRIAAIAEDHLHRWPRGAPMAIDAAMREVTAAVIVEWLVEDLSVADRDHLLSELDGYLMRIAWETAYAIFRLPRWLPHPATYFLHRKAKRIREIIGGIIDKHGTAAGDAATHDLVGKLKAARHPDTGEPMDREKLIDNTLAMIGAGHDTTAHTLAFALYLVSQSPEWQTRVSEEARAVLGDRASETLAARPGLAEQLTAARQVILETLRLYPAAPVMARRPLEPVEIDGWEFDTNDQLVLPIYCLHRHRKLWTDPDVFDPDRFPGGSHEMYPRTQFMPFGAGPRICMGAQLALLEATVLLSIFAKDTRITFAGTEHPMPVSRVTLRPVPDVPLIFEAR